MIQRILASLTRDLGLKITALALAFLLWTSVRAEEPAEWTSDIGILVLNDDPDWIVVPPPSPPLVRVTFRGPYGQLLRASSERPEIIVPFESVDDSVITRIISRNWVRMPPGTEQVVVSDIQPAEVRVAFDRVVTRLLNVAPVLRGALAPGLELAGPVTVEPGVVRASGPGRTLARIDSLRLPAIELDARRDTDTLMVTIDTTGTGLILSPRTVRVIVPVRPIPSDTSALPLTAVPPRRPGG